MGTDYGNSVDLFRGQVLSNPTEMTNPARPNPVISTANPVTLVGPGDSALQDIDDLLALGPGLVAADGGAAQALAAGHCPDAVIGDLDSLPQSARAALPEDRLHRIEEQDTTDFEKCLMRIAAPVILATGFTGGRVDHQLAVMNALVAHDARCVVVGGEDLIFHVPVRIKLELTVGSRLSLFPMAEVTGQSEGLEWAIDGLRFSPSGRIGTSNRVTGPVRLNFDAPGMLVITPRAALRAVLQGLRPGMWPVPGQ
jgi:thiamine pyrophosphokinase